MLENTTIDNLDDLLNEVQEEFFKLQPPIGPAHPPETKTDDSESNLNILVNSFVTALATENFQLTDRLLKENKTVIVNEIKKLEETEGFLFQIIRSGNSAACQYLIENKLVDQHKLQQHKLWKAIGPLTYAIMKNQFDIADYFVKKNMVSDIEDFAKNESMPFLFSLITMDHLNGCKYLFKNGLVKNNLVATEKRFNAFMCAASLAKLDIANFLMNMPGTMDYVKKWTFYEENEVGTHSYSFPFYLLEIVKYIKPEAFFYLFDKEIFSINLKDNRGLSFLMKALVFGRLDIADGLMKRGCDLSYVKTWRTSIEMPFLSFLLVTMKAKKSCEWLLQHNLFETVDYEKKELDPLFLAIKEGLFEIADLLLEQSLSRKWITLINYIKEGNIAACVYLVEKELVQIDEKVIQLAKKRNYPEIAQFLEESKKNLFRKLKEKREKQFEKIQGFFQKLREDNPSLISAINTIINYQLVIELNPSHRDYSKLVTQIQKHSSYFVFNGRPLKSITLSTLKISEADFNIVQSVFQLDQNVEKKKQPSIIIKSTEPDPFGLPEATESPAKPIPEKNPTSTVHSAKPKKPEHPAQPNKKLCNKQTNKKTTKPTRPVVKIPKTNLREEVEKLPPRELPKEPKASFYDDLETVKRHLAEKIEYTIAPSESESLPLKQTLCFHYYETGLPGQKKTIKELILPDEKVAYLDELINISLKVRYQIKNPNQTHIVKQAFLYDFFFLLELTQKTFESVENIDDMISLFDIKQLRQSMKTFVFNQRKQNVHLANLTVEAEKFCQQLQRLNEALRTHQHQLNKVGRLKLVTETLQTRDNQVAYQYNLSFFKNVDGKSISEIQFLNLLAYVEEFLQYMAIIEDASKTVEEKSIALSAAKWCIIGLDKQQKIFEKYIGKSTELNDTFLLIHTARNRLAHSEGTKNSGTLRNPIMDEEVLLTLKNSMLTLQKLAIGISVIEKWSPLFSTTLL